MVADSGSARKPTSTEKPPAGIHLNRIWLKLRAGSSSARRPRNRTTLAPNEPATMAVASQPASGLAEAAAADEQDQEAGQGQGRDEPGDLEHEAPQPLSREVSSAVAMRPPPEDGHDDPEADDDLGGRHHQHEEHDHLAADVVELAGEGDEGEVDGVEHQLDAHEHHQRVAPDQQPDGAEGEQQGGQHEVPARGDGGDDHEASTSSSASASSSTRSPGSTATSLVVVDLVAGAGPGQQDGADDGDDQQERGDLEGEQVVGEQQAADLGDVVAVAHPALRPRRARR